MINVDDSRIIERKAGLPQGSELVPLLFNYYIHCIWQRWHEYRKKHLTSFKFQRDFLYVDNWTTVLDAEDRNHAFQYASELNFFISQFGLLFDMEDLQIIQTERVESNGEIANEVVEALESEARVEEEAHHEDLQPDAEEVRMLGFYFKPAGTGRYMYTY